MFAWNKFSKTHAPIDDPFVIRVEQMQPVAMNAHAGFVNVIMYVASDVQPAITYINCETGSGQLAGVSRAREARPAC
jgi:acetylglutamate kinase